MEAIALSGSIRTTSGKGSNRKLRAAGSIPAILYGHGLSESRSVTLDPRALGKALENPKGANGLVVFSVEGSETHTVLVREIQRDAVSRKILHVDLIAPDLDADLVAIVPVNYSGKSPGVALGGRLQTPCREVKLVAKPGDIPAEIAIDLATLDIGDTLMVSQLPVPENTSILFDTDFVAAKVSAARGAQDDEEETVEAEEE
jgi:large subunit ribosomal protein L25